jgi:hypothetical protein
VRLGFTDAARIRDDLMAFMAAAEATDDAYEDAPCAGSVFGLLSGRFGTPGVIIDCRPVDRPAKVEGLQVEPGQDGLDILMVTDADDPGQPALLLEARYEAFRPPYR